MIKSRRNTLSKCQKPEIFQPANPYFENMKSPTKLNDFDPKKSEQQLGSDTNWRDVNLEAETDFRCWFSGYKIEFYRGKIQRKFKPLKNVSSTSFPRTPPLCLPRYPLGSRDRAGGSNPLEREGELERVLLDWDKMGEVLLLRSVFLQNCQNKQKWWRGATPHVTLTSHSPAILQGSLILLILIILIIYIYIYI